MAPPRLLAVAPDGWADRPDFARDLQRLAAATAVIRGQVGVYLRAHGQTRARWQAMLTTLPRDTGLRLGISCPSDLDLPADVEDLAAAGVDFLHLTEAHANRPLDPALVAPLHISRVCHDPRDARRRWQLGADWLVVSPVFSTPSKPDAVPLGLAGLGVAIAAAPGRVVALGGINADNALECFRSGASGVAVQRAAWTAADSLALRLGMLDGTAPLDDDTGA